MMLQPSLGIVDPVFKNCSLFDIKCQGAELWQYLNYGATSPTPVAPNGPAVPSQASLTTEGADPINDVIGQSQARYVQAQQDAITTAEQAGYHTDPNVSLPTLPGTATLLLIGGGLVALLLISKR